MRKAGLNIVITGNAKGATTAFGQAQKGAQKLTGTVAGLAARMGGVFAVGLGARTGIREAEAWASTVAQTEAVIRSTGNAANYAAGEQLNYVKALERKVAVDREIINQGANVLRTFTKISDAATFERSLELAVDMAQALDMGVQPAATMLGKALQDPIKGLTAMSRAGVSFTAQQKEQVKLLMEQGRLFEAQQLILQELAVQYGGAAAANADASEKARLALENMAGSVMRVFMPALAGAATVLETVAGGFERLPSAAQTGVVAFTGLALLAPRLMAGYRGASSAVTMFRLGLAGATEKGAGASNAMGGLIARMGGVRVAAVAAGAAVAILAVGMAIWQQRQQEAAEAAARLEEATASLRAEMERTSRTAAEAFSASRLPDLAEQYPEFIALLNEAGSSVVELADAVGGSDAEWDRYIKSLDLAGLRGEALRKALNLEREAVLAATDGARTKSQVNEDLGNSTDDLTDATEDNTKAVKDNRTAYERALEAYEKHKAQVDRRIDSARALESAERSTKEAVAELAEAQAEAAGKSEAVRDAQEAVTDAREREVDAAEAVTEAQKRLTDAQQDLNEATRTATDRLREKAIAAREAADAEAGAELAVDRARKELERARAGGADALTIREKEQALREAQTAVVAARQEAKTAAQENDQAQRAGVAGDEQVVAAKKAVEDASRGVADAEKAQREAREATGEAERRVGQIIQAAKRKIEDAARRVEDAMMDEARAAGEAAEAQGGAAAGAQAHADRLNDLSNQLAPDSPLRKRLRDYAGELLFVRNLELGYHGREGEAVAAGAMSLAAAEAQIAANPGSAGPGRSMTVNQTLVLQGTPQQTRRAARDATGNMLDEVARGGG